MAAGVPLVIRQLRAGVSPDWLVTRPMPAPWLPLVILTVNGPFRNTAETVRLEVSLKVQAPRLLADQDVEPAAERGAGRREWR